MAAIETVFDGPLSFSEPVIQLTVDRVVLPLDQPPLLRASPVDLMARRTLLLYGAQ